jgi:hypothetical protein
LRGLLINESTNATSRNAYAQLGFWDVGQDSALTGTRNFYVKETSGTVHLTLAPTTGNATLTGNLTVSGGTVGTAASTNLTLAGGSSGATLVLGQGASGNATITTSGSGFGLVSNATPIWRLNNTTIALTTNNTIGSLQFYSNDPSTNLTGIAAAIVSTLISDGTGGQSNSSLDFHTRANATSDATIKARLTDSGNLLIGGTTDITGSGGLKVFGTTASTSTTTGALQVAGGVGVAGALFVGGNLTVLGTSSRFQNTLALRAPGNTCQLDFQNSSGTVIQSIKYNDPDGSLTIGGSSAVNVPIFFNSATSVERARFTTTGNLLIGGTTDISGSGGLKVFGATASTSTTTGALQVAGGVGVGGAAFFGGAIAIGNTVNTVTATLPNRTITIEIGGTTYYIHAKTTND